MLAVNSATARCSPSRRRHRVDPCTHRKALHLRGIERCQNLRQRLHILEAGVEPKGVVLRAENYRHSIMDVRQQRVRSGGQNRASLNQTTARVFPSIPKTGKGKQGIVLHSEVEGLLLFAASHPFEKPVGRQQATAAHEGIAKGGLTRDRFRAGIDRLESNAGVRGPGRNQAPVSYREMPLRPGWILTNDSNRRVTKGELLRC